VPCSLMAGGATVSVSCTVQSAVHAIVEFPPYVQVVSVALMHNGQVFVLDEVETGASV
jgi:hypothetical protein